MRETVIPATGPKVQLLPPTEAAFRPIFPGPAPDGVDVEIVGAEQLVGLEEGLSTAAGVPSPGAPVPTDYVPYRRPVIEGGGLQGRATAVLGPDDRASLAGIGWFGYLAAGTGTLVGPRHVLTASHNLCWDAQGNPEPNLVFAPAWTNGTAPFGTFQVEKVYAIRKVVPDQNGNLDAADMAYDFAVVVLKVPTGTTPPGNVTGWLATSFWSPTFFLPGALDHAGYPGSALLPRHVSGGTVTSATLDFTHVVPGRRIVHDVDVEPGQSGGPLMVWSAAANPTPPTTPLLPVVVGVQSAELSGNQGNVASGGWGMAALVAYALQQSP